MNNIYRNVINWLEARNIKVDEYGGLEDEQHAFIEINNEKYNLEILDHEDGVTINLFYYRWKDWEEVEQSEFCHTYKTVGGATRRLEKLFGEYSLLE